MKKRLRVLIIGIFVLFIIVPHGSANPLQSQIEQILQTEADLKGAVIGISVRSAKTGDVQYDYNGNTRLKPASNMKLTTAAVALSVLGENYTFQTEVRTDGMIKGRTLKGNLYLIGRGDPTLREEDFNQLASEIKGLGITRIEGNLIGDDSWYDDVRFSPDMIWSDEDDYYGAQISALTASPDKDYDAGTVVIDVEPGKMIGDPAIISLVPQTKYVHVVNHVTTVTPEEKAKVTIKRLHGTNTVMVEGMIPLKSIRKREFVGIWEPTGYALDLFRLALERHGITVSGNVTRGKSTKSQRLAVHHSPTLAVLMVPFLKLSNNVHAEILVKELGRKGTGQGSWKNGLRVVKNELRKFGVDSDVLVLRDGSGISHINSLTVNELTKLLYQVQGKPWFKTFYDSLPVAGKKDKLVGGTLRKRMAHLDVHAKTGTLTTVSSISGYVKIKSGETVIFSILINNILNEDKGKIIEDKLVEIIANQSF